MSEELDNILHDIDTVGSTCCDFNGNGELTNQEQKKFYQFYEHIILLLSQMNASYDKLSEKLIKDTKTSVELNSVWAESNTALDNLSRSITSLKMQAAVSKTALAIDHTSSIQAKL